MWAVLGPVESVLLFTVLFLLFPFLFSVFGTLFPLGGGGGGVVLANLLAPDIRTVFMSLMWGLGGLLPCLYLISVDVKHILSLSSTLALSSAPSGVFVESGSD